MFGFFKNKVPIIMQADIQPSKICPYCQKVLSKAPQKKIQCPFCNHFMYVRTDPKTRKKILVTEKEVDKIQKEYQKLAAIEECLRNTDYLGINQQLFDQTKQELTARWMPKYHQEASAVDTMWGVLAKKELEFAKKGDWYKLKMISLSWAILCMRIGRNPAPFLQKTQQANIREITDNNLNIKIQIVVNNDSCERCKELNGRIYTGDDTLHLMPLPNKNCETFMGNWAESGWCKCYYNRIVD